MLFTLMNKNEKVLDFEYDLEYDAYLGVKEIHSLKFAPIPLTNCLESELSQIFFQWLNDRKIPPLRDNIQYLLDSLKESNSMTSMINSCGLSLSDQYWFLPVNYIVSWNDINYFDNPYNSNQFFKSTFGQDVKEFIDLNHNDNLKNHSTPNMSTNGQLGKCWIQQNGLNYLVKGANTINRFEAISEYIASVVCHIFEVPYVSYRCLSLQGKRTSTVVSVCPVMINKNQEYIPAYQILSEKKKKLKNTRDDYYLYLEILQEHQVPKAEEYIQKMMMIDFILGNEDRHLGNFGVIRNVNTLKWESVCPIFDTGRSLNTNIAKDYWLDINADMKFFTHEFISDDIVASYFCYSIKADIIHQLNQVVVQLREELKKYSSILDMNETDISILEKSFHQRIEKYKKIMLSKNLILDEP